MDSSAYEDGDNCVQTCSKYISVDLRKCTTACGDNEYNDSTICKTCSSGIAGCSTCTKPTITLLCTMCTGNYWLSVD